ncbi:thioesterase domain-containing protein, partial [Fulvivirga kasyanovii]
RANDENIFFIHDGSGDIQGYTDLASRMKNLNCWGIKSEMLRSIEPQNRKIEDLAIDYIHKMKAVQPKGPYKILGWSTGGLIAFEMASQLEKLDECGNKLIIIDSAFPVRDQQTIPIDPFSLEGERTLLSKFSIFQMVGEKGEKPIDNINTLWSRVVSILKESKSTYQDIKKIIPPDIFSVMPNITQIEPYDFVVYLNTIRSLQHAVSTYQINDVQSSELNYIKATETPFSIGGLKERITSDIYLYEIDGNHFSIVKSPRVECLVELLYELLTSKSSCDLGYELGKG